MKAPEHIFRAYDIRGVIGKDLMPTTILETSAIFANIISEIEGDFVAVGGDVRISTPTLIYASISGIISAGVNVEAVFPLPIPVFNFYIWQSDYLDGGAYITASHNPPEYNGIRFRRADGTGFSGENRIIKERYYKGEIKFASWKNHGAIIFTDASQVILNYVEFAESNINEPSNKLSLIIDGMYGSANLVTPDLFHAFGHKTIFLDPVPDGAFPLGMPDPLHGDTSRIRSAVKTSQADLGIAYDGDGDRAAFFDQEGRLIPAEVVGLYLAEKLLSPGDYLVYNSMCSSFLRRKAEEMGFKTVESRVGDVFMAEKAKEYNAKLGIEESYHFFVPLLGFYYDDAILTSVLLVNLLADDEIKGTDLYERYGTFHVLRKNIEVSENKKFEAVEKFKKWAETNYSDISTVDGVRIYLDYGSILVRPSNTEPLIRIVVDAEDKKALEEIYESFIKILQKIIRS